MTNVYAKKVTLPDGSSFWRGECNGCDWIDEGLYWSTQLNSRAEVHLKVFHNGGVIKHPVFEQEVKGR